MQLGLSGGLSGAQPDQPVVDGFTHSLSTLLLPTTYRASVLSQMDTLRRATNYQFKMHSAPSPQQNPIPAFTQLEYQVKMRPGTFIWGWYFNLNSSNIFINVVDMGSGMELLSDYIVAAKLTNQSVSPTPARVFPRFPFLLAGPRLISGDGLVNIEIYNSSTAPASCQFVLYCAEPKMDPGLCDPHPIPCSQD